MLPFVAGPSTLTRSAFDIGCGRTCRRVSVHEIKWTALYSRSGKRFLLPYQNETVPVE